MFIGIRRLVISLSFVLLSRGSFATPLSLSPCLLTSPLWVPSVQCLLDGVRPSSNRSDHESRWRLLQPIPLHPPLFLLLLLWVVWCFRKSLGCFSTWMLTLTLWLIRWVRWPSVWVVLHDIRLALMASLLLPLHLHKLQRTRMMMMASMMMMMMMRMRMRTLPMMRRWLLLNDLPFVIRD